MYIEAAPAWKPSTESLWFGILTLAPKPVIISLISATDSTVVCGKNDVVGCWWL